MTPEDIKKLKQKINDHLQKSDDPTASKMLQETVTMYSLSSKKDILDELSPYQRKRLEESILQLGQTISDEEVMQRAKLWLMDVL